MIRITTLMIVGVALAAFPTTKATAYEALQSTDEPDPRALIEQAAEAHGGRKAWLATPAVRLRFVMHLTTLSPDTGEGRLWSDSWRNYDTTIDPDTSRAFVEVHWANNAGAETGFDGTRLWDGDVPGDPHFRDPAFMLNWYHYGMVALPFIAAAEGASFDYLGMDSLPGHPKQHHKILVDYAPAAWVGDMTIYIDPDTNLIRGWEQGTMFPPLPGNPLPSIQQPPARPLRVIDHYFSLGEFTLPRTYVSYTPAGDVGAHHMVQEAEILGEFDEGAAAVPAGARIVYDAKAQ